MFDFGSIFTSVVGGLMGSQQKAPEQPVAPSASLNPSQVPAQPDPVPPAPPPRGLGAQLRDSGHQFFADVADQAGQTARKAMFASMEGKIAGKAQKAYNDSAFPGTTPWEQLGGGSPGAGADYSGMAAKAEELTQRERESQRAANVQLQSARIGAGERLATTLLTSGGDPRMIADILLKTGAFPPEHGLRVENMSRDKLASEIESNLSGAGFSRAQTETDDLLREPRKNLTLAQEGQANTAASLNMQERDFKRMMTVLEPFKYYLDSWAKQSGNSRVANEALGLYNKVLVPLAAKTGFDWSTIQQDDLMEFLVDSIADHFGSEYADSFRRYYKDVP